MRQATGPFIVVGFLCCLCVGCVCVCIYMYVHTHTMNFLFTFGKTFRRDTVNVYLVNVCDCHRFLIVVALSISPLG